MNNRTRLGRLRKLADLLEGITDKKHFQMHRWASHDGEIRAESGATAPHLDNRGQLGCGTAACALGYASLHPSFRRGGLRLGKRRHWAHGLIWSPLFGRRHGFGAGEAFFGLTGEETRSVFDPASGAGNTPKQVARNVRKLIRQYERQSA